MATILARAGMLGVVPGRAVLGGAGTFVDYVRSEVGIDFAAVSVQLGPPRVNRKPVLRLMDCSGQALAFIKLGVTPLTCERVRAEAAALHRLARAKTPGLITPSVQSAGQWQGLDYLILSPLDTTGGPVGPMARQRASTALVGAFDVEQSPLGEATWWLRALARLESCDDEVPEVRRLRRAGRLLIERHGATEMTTGASHGDWSPWNTCLRDSNILAWDWERFSTTHPIGWDEIHYRLSEASGGPAVALRRMHEELLEKHGRGSVQEAILATYLMDRGIRFVADDHQRAGTPSGPLGTWLLPVLENVVGTTGSA